MRRNMLQQLGRDEDGNVAMFGALAMALILVGAVATVDYSLATNNRHESQNTADALSLAAAVKMGQIIQKNRSKKGVTPPTDFYAEGKVYTAKELGFEFQGLAEGTDVEITFHYDIENNEVRTVVTGESKSTLMTSIGVETLPFSSESTSEFPSPELQYPASIAMVIDNSNSMWSDEDPSADWDQDHYDREFSKARKHNGHSASDEIARQVPTGTEKRPAGTEQRIVSLRTALTSLNSTLYETVLGQVDQKYLRTGLIPFNHQYISNKASSMNWGTLPAGKISGMSPSGKTDTSRGMDKAWDWLRNEHYKYDAEIRDGLKRYVILMTDGQNTTNRTVQVDKPGSGKWRGQEQRTRGAYTDRGRPCTRRETRYRNSGEAGRTSYSACVAWGPPRNRYVPAKTYYRWVTKYQATRPTGGKDWKEVDWVDRTRHTCDKMKEEGWTIFTIGYALTPGIFQRNLPGRPPKEYWATDQHEVAKAESLLDYCATSEEHAIKAQNANQLNEAFEDIGETIASDTTVRIKI
jgi:hypothetical protein